MLLSKPHVLNKYSLFAPRWVLTYHFYRRLSDSHIRKPTQKFWERKEFCDATQRRKKIHKKIIGTLFSRAKTTNKEIQSQQKYSLEAEAIKAWKHSKLEILWVASGIKCRLIDKLTAPYNLNVRKTSLVCYTYSTLVSKQSWTTYIFTSWNRSCLLNSYWSSLPSFERHNKR